MLQCAAPSQVVGVGTEGQTPRTVRHFAAADGETEDGGEGDGEDATVSFRRGALVPGRFKTPEGSAVTVTVNTGVGVFTV